MKKITLTLALIISSLVTFAQQPAVLETYKNSVGYYNSSTKKYDFETYAYSNLTFSFYDTYVSVNDIMHSVYRITEILPKNVTKTSETASVRCLDERNRSCIVSLMANNNGAKSAIYITYEDRMFLYIIDK